MELRDYLFLLAKRWRFVVVIVLITLGAAAGATFLMKPTYEAQTQLFVSVRAGAKELPQLYQGSDFSQQRVKSYANLATSPAVTRPVVQQLRLDVTPEQLAERITAEAPLDTVLINLTVSNSSPQMAAETANALAKQLATFVQKVEKPPRAQTSPVKVSIVQEAQPPLEPVSPRPFLNLALGLLTGLALGVGGAVLRESLDTSVKNAGDLEEATELPVLATIRHDPDAVKAPIVRGDPHSSRIEAFRQLRTNLQYADVDHRPRVVVVTSARDSEGKSSVAGNLALTLAQSGHRVCLVDGDLRRPCVADYFSLVGEVGLTTVLAGRTSIWEVIQPAVAGVDIVTSGETPPNPSELLGSQRMEATIHELSQRYDIVLIDAPPVLPVTDAAVLASEARAALLVVRAGKTSGVQAAEAVAGLRNVGARVLGGVINMAPTKGRDAKTYGYGYTYAPNRSGHRRRSQSRQGGAARPVSRDPVNQEAADLLEERR